MSFDPVSYLMGTKAGGGGGGGNPNYIETISGTLANPWGGRFSEIVNMLQDTDNYTVNITAYGFTASLVVDYGTIYWSCWFDDIDAGTPSTANVYTLAWNNSGDMVTARAWLGGSWGSLKSTASTTLTIIHHPMTGALTPAETQTFGGDA